VKGWRGHLLTKPPRLTLVHYSSAFFLLGYPRVDSVSCLASLRATKVPSFCWKLCTWIWAAETIGLIQKFSERFTFTLHLFAVTLFFRVVYLPCHWSFLVCALFDLYSFIRVLTLKSDILNILTFFQSLKYLIEQNILPDYANIYNSLHMHISITFL
jgi:hypothetical protein